MNLEGACRAIDTEPWRGKLIEDYHACAVKWASQINQRYPGEDFELPVMSGLYLAAATWERGRMSFFGWLKIKIRGSTRFVLRSRRRRRAGYKRDGVLPAGMTERPRTPPIRFTSLLVSVIDRQFVYRDNEMISDR